MSRKELYSGIFYLLATISAVSCAGDCMYNKCEFKFTRTGYHEPCMGTGGRSLIRNVECEDGNTIHICCKLPYRDDIQKSRQKWFRKVTETGLDISGACTKRVLCEQSCKDGLNGQARSDYPEVLPDDTPENQDFVKAYYQGESQACYNHNKTDNNQNENQNNLYDGAHCESECQKKYPECDSDMEDSLRTEYFYKSSTIFHQLGMWSFTATWLAQDTLDAGVSLGKDALTAIKTAYTKVYERMKKMNRAFQKILSTLRDGDQHSEHQHERKRRSAGSTESANDVSRDNAKWENFLISYNETDPKLVESVYQSLNYTHFQSSMSIINSTLATYNFGAEVWIYNDGSGIVANIMTICLMLVIAIVCMSHQ